MATISTFFAGSSVMANVAMSATSLEAIWQRLRNDEVLKAEVERLRKVKRIDAAAYTRLKVNLPFFCCAIFQEGMRHSRNFISVQAFVVDIDKYSGEQARLEALRNRICSDDRVAMCFVSPSGDGLKVVFTLAEPCTNLKQFSDFYKAFVSDWASQLDIANVVDLRTADATRVCFLSHDSTAYMNPLSESVDMNVFLPNFNTVESLLFEPNNAATDVLVEVPTVTTTAAAPKAAPKTFEPDANCSHHIQPDTYTEVLALLKSKARPNPLQRKTVVPEPLVRLLEPLVVALSKHQINVLAALDIQYGKQLQAQCENDLAEVNIYYGKKGFSVVLSTKSGTNPMLNELVGFIAEQTIATVFIGEYKPIAVEMN
jgi:hypothetical protein